MHDIEALPSRVADLAATVPKEQVLLTRGGQPFAIVSDASIYDWEDIGYMTDPKFWEMIRERRKEDHGIPLEVLEAEIAEEERAAARKAGVAKTKNGRKKAS